MLALYILLGQDAPSVSPFDQPWLLLASVAMCAMSFFLLHQSARFLKWVTAKDETAPNPWSGVVFAYILSLAIIELSCFYWMSHVSKPSIDMRADVGPLPWYIL